MQLYEVEPFPYLPGFVRSTSATELCGKIDASQSTVWFLALVEEEVHPPERVDDAGGPRFRASAYERGWSLPAQGGGHHSGQSRVFPFRYSLQNSSVIFAAASYLPLNFRGTPYSSPKLKPTGNSFVPNPRNGRTGGLVLQGTAVSGGPAEKGPQLLAGVELECRTLSSPTR